MSTGKSNRILVFILLFIAFATSGQSDYDHIFSLLEAKEFGKAAPALRKYVSESGRNANAWTISRLL